MLSRGLCSHAEMAQWYNLTEAELAQEQASQPGLLTKFLNLDAIPETEPVEVPWEHLPAQPGEEEIAHALSIHDERCGDVPSTATIRA